MSQRTPPPPHTLPEQPEFHSKRYRRRKRPIIWQILVFALVLGIGGGLYYAWEVAPLEEFDTAPHQLREDDQQAYVVAIALNFSFDSDLASAIEHLLDVGLGDDPLQSVAGVACDLARTGYVDSSSGLRAVRALKTFYQLQGRTGCADVLIPDVEDPQVVEIDVPTPTPTLPPPPSKTPTVVVATPTQSGIFIVPTTAPRRQYEGRIAGTFCDVDLSGIIEVFVQSANGDGIAGERIRVRWDDGEDSFVSGLKPERGPSYADFQMQAGVGYTIDMPALSDPVDRPIVAEPCFTEDGFQATTSYRVVFQQIG
jgi:hypothetical protein